MLKDPPIGNLRKTSLARKGASPLAAALDAELQQRSGERPQGGSSRRAWTTTNKILGATALGLIGVDWLQTIDIARNPHRYREHNPFLGRHPSVGKVNTMIPLGAAALGLAAHLLPSNKRNIALGAFNAIELANVLRNHRGGLRFNFNF